MFFPLCHNNRGPFKCYVTFFSWKFDARPPPSNANNVEPYTFVMLFSGKAVIPLCYVTREWPTEVGCNFVFRTIIRYDRTCSASGMFVRNNVMSFNDICRGKCTILNMSQKATILL